MPVQFNATQKAVSFTSNVVKVDPAKVITRPPIFIREGCTIEETKKIDIFFEKLSDLFNRILKKITPSVN
jgi:hypothetical protein